MWIRADEAHTHLCPQQLPTGGHCQGRKCMAWRWHPHWMDECVHTEEGYCGLAGKPLRAVLESGPEDAQYMTPFDHAELGEEPIARGLGADVVESVESDIAKHVASLLKKA